MQLHQEKSIIKFFTDYESTLVEYSNRLVDFFEKYTDDVYNYQKGRLLALPKRLEYLINNLIPKKQDYIDENKIHAFDYNVFYIIGRSKSNPEGYSRYETITHSPFLADLLNSNSFHGQQDLFYRNFIGSIRNLPEAKKTYFLKVAYNDYWVKKEENHIDILIRSFKQGNQFAIIIENKINNAGDQEKQLEHYYEEVQKRCDLSNNQILVIYLTPDGRQPTDYSIKIDMQKRLINDNVLFCLSIMDIVNWIEQCKLNVKSSKVQVILEQYLLTLKNL